MAAPVMTNAHETRAAAPWQWRLDSRRAQRLAAVPALRWLAVEEGRVWLTRSQHSQQPPADLWLCAGERVALPAGSDWVAEGWPEARVVVMQAPAGG